MFVKMWVRGKNPPGKKPPDSKLNPTPNLTLTLPLTPHGGEKAFFRGDFFLTLIKAYYIKGVHRVKKENICSQMFDKVVALKPFAKFTGKHLCWNHFLIKLQT